MFFSYFILGAWVLLFLCSLLLEVRWAKKQMRFRKIAAIPIIFAVFAAGAWYDLSNTPLDVYSKLVFFFPPIIQSCWYFLFYYYYQWKGLSRYEKKE